MIEKFTKFEKIWIGIENPRPKTIGIFSIHHQPVLVQWVISFNYLPCSRSALIFEWRTSESLYNLFLQFFYNLIFYFFYNLTFNFFLQSDFLIFLQSDFPIFWVQGFWEFVQSDLQSIQRYFSVLQAQQSKGSTWTLSLDQSVGFTRLLVLYWKPFPEVTTFQGDLYTTIEWRCQKFSASETEPFLKRFFCFWCWCQTRKKRKYIH